MEATSLDQWLFLIYFVYGLAFFGMGLAMALESGRSPGLAAARTLRPLAAFGIIHGAHEWFESYLMQAAFIPSPLPLWVPWLRIGTLAVSFPCLFLFAYRLQGDHAAGPLRWMRGQAALILYWLAVAFSAATAYGDGPLPGLVFWDVMARYMLAVPASLLSMLALWRQARGAASASRPVLARYFAFAAAGFGIYAATQLFVHPLDMFPANLLNQAVFSHYTGLPIQLIRAGVAVLITWSLIRATQAVEEERHAQLYAMQQARLEAMQQREELRGKLLQHTVQAQEDERARISRELHDETAQVLSAFSLQLAALDSGSRLSPEAQRKVQDLQDLSRQVSKALYRLVHDLRPAQLDDLGLIPALDYLLAEARAGQGLDIQMQVGGEVRRLALPVETILFRVAQEAITNIIRHAHASRAHVELEFSAGEVRLTVADEGQGFDVDSVFHAPRGWGLEGMRERVEAAGGRFTLASLRGCGTTVGAVIPVPPVIAQDGPAPRPEAEPRRAEAEGERQRS